MYFNSISPYNNRPLPSVKRKSDAILKFTIKLPIELIVLKMIDIYEYLFLFIINFNLYIPFDLFVKI